MTKQSPQSDKGISQAPEPTQNKLERKNIFIENDEEIPAVIAKIKSAGAEKLILVVPRGSVLLQSLINLKLLDKQAEAIGKKISLVTSDRIGINLAFQAGIPVYESIHASQPLTPPSRVSPKQPEVIKIDKTTPEPDELPGGVRVRHFQDVNRGMKDKNSQPAPAEKKDSSEEEKFSSQPLTVKEEAASQSQIEKRPSDQPLQSTTEAASSHSMPPTLASGKAAPLKISLRPRLKINPKKSVVLFFILACLAGLFYLFIPRARIILTVKGEEFSTKSKIEVNLKTKAASLEKRQIPGHLVEMEKKEEAVFQASGTKNVGEKAVGKVVFYNSWSTNPQVIPAGTILVRSGKELVTLKDVSVPGANLVLSQGSVQTNPGTAEADVEAKEAGEEYNLAPGRFDIVGFSAEKQAKFYAKNNQALTGGSTRQVKVVSAADIEKAKETLRGKLEKLLRQSLHEKYTKLTLLDEAVEFNILSQQANVKEDEEAEEFKLTLTLRARGIGFEKATFQKIFVDLVKQDLPAGKSLHLSQTDQINTQVKGLDLDEGKLIVQGDLKTHLTPALDEAKLKKLVYGKKITQAEKILTAQPGIDKATIQLTPNWFIFVPYFSFAVHSEIEYQ